MIDQIEYKAEDSINIAAIDRYCLVCELFPI